MRKKIELAISGTVAVGSVVAICLLPHAILAGGAGIAIGFALGSAALQIYHTLTRPNTVQSQIEAAERNAEIESEKRIVTEKEIRILEEKVALMKTELKHYEDDDAKHASAGEQHDLTSPHQIERSPILRSALFAAPYTQDKHKDSSTKSEENNSFFAAANEHPAPQSGERVQIRRRQPGGA